MSATALAAITCAAPQPLPSRPLNACEQAAPISAFHTSLAAQIDSPPSLDLLDIWWRGTTATAAALFHTEGQSAIARREFFSRHVFTDQPTLVVDGDTFALSPDFALAVAQLALLGQQPDRAAEWLRRAQSDERVDACRAFMEGAQ